MTYYSTMRSKTILVLVSALLLSSSIGSCRCSMLCDQFPWLCDRHPWLYRRLLLPYNPLQRLHEPLHHSPPLVDVGRPIFNVLRFGAKGDGKTNDTAAFQSAWGAACHVEASTVLIPEGYEFLVTPINFDGLDCKKNIVFQLDGTIVAPENHTVWGNDRTMWIKFSWTTGLSVQGNGTIEGRGSDWWHSDGHTDTEVAQAEHLLGARVIDNYDKAQDGQKPTALTIYQSDFVTLTGIRIQNTPSFHVSIMNCEQVYVYNLTVSSPGDSPNTDGIQVHRSKHVVIHNTTLACGDDCIAIQKGCRNVTVYNVKCGPGHGISIGSLGQDYSKACVSDIRVQDIDMHNTTNGARIKTWQGGFGCVQGVTFSDIRMTRVRYPIIVDQYYCDVRIPDACRNESWNVAVSGITYENIRGTYMDIPIAFLCSDNVPCTNITFDRVDLKPEEQHNHDLPGQESKCGHVYGHWVSKPSNALCDVQSGRPPTYSNVKYNMNQCQ